MPLMLSYVLFALMGLTTAGFSLTWACSKEVNPPLLSGMSTSVANMGGFLAGALLQTAGWLDHGSWLEGRDGQWCSLLRCGNLALRRPGSRRLRNSWRSILLVDQGNALPEYLAGQPGWLIVANKV